MGNIIRFLTHIVNQWLIIWIKEQQSTTNIEIITKYSIYIKFEENYVNDVITTKTNETVLLESDRAWLMIELIQFTRSKYLQKTCDIHFIDLKYDIKIRWRDGRELAILE